MRIQNHDISPNGYEMPTDNGNQSKSCNSRTRITTDAMNEIERQLETENLRNQREKLEKKTTILTKVGADIEKPYNRQRKTKGINKQTNKQNKNKQTNVESRLREDSVQLSAVSCPRPSKPSLHNVTSSAAQNAQTPGAAAAQLETDQRWPGRTASRPVKASRSSS